ncbi:MAG: DedA family protein [Nocardioides sp.]
MSGLVAHLLAVPGPWAYVVIGLLVFVEAAIFVGFVVPGETAVLLGGLLASTGHLSLWLLLGLVVGAGVLGDSVGFEVGRRLGPRLGELRPLRRHRNRIEAARGYLRRRGGRAVVLGRFTAFLRAMMPALAGASGMRYRRFLVFNVVGGLVWGAGVTLLGYFAGSSIDAVAQSLGRGSAAVLIIVAVTGLVTWRLRRRHHDRTPGETAAGA